MKEQKNSPLIWMPIAIAIAVVAGILIGENLTGVRSGASRFLGTDHDRKLNTILNLVAEDYVDTIDIDELIEVSIPDILANLDPHTVYIPAKDLRAVNEELDGSFSGIGVSFTLINDTITVIEVLSGGPSEKVGLMAGDRIVTIDDSVCTGRHITQEEVQSRLKGPKGTTVNVGIVRSSSPDVLQFEITRGDVAVHSVDCHYMLDKQTGYIKINKFGRTTYDEFLSALLGLRNNGAKQYVIDLRGNAGGYMEMAILMANEFLPAGELIVYTKGREHRTDTQVWSDGNGSFQDSELVVLMDEYSASASEIFAGAIQDNDRGLIVGVRSFGKGLVQRQIDLPDSSALRITIARYYTPSGRCIQKDYNSGSSDYNREVYERYNSGELYNRDSIHVDEQNIFMTAHGRRVYGGGGILPDIFVAADTTGYTPYYIAVVNAGLLQKFAFSYTDINRAALSELTDYKHLMRVMPSNEALLSDFVSFAADAGVQPRWYFISLSHDIILTQLKALIARDVFGAEAFYPIYNRNDRTIEAAMRALSDHRAAFPIVAEDDAK